MPSYKGHLVGGVVTYILMIKLLTWMGIVHSVSIMHHCILLTATLLGSLFPDIDIQSKGQRLLYMAMAFMVPLSFFYHKSIFLGLSLLCLILVVIPHRTLTHSLWFIVLTPTVITLAYMHTHPHLIRTIPVSICILFISGALNHRLLDVGFKRFFSKR